MIRLLYLTVLTTLLSSSLIMLQILPASSDPPSNTQSLDQSMIDERKPSAPTIDTICKTLAKSAEQFDIPQDFFARLIWKESRFDHLAVSPVGAQGIAQFMPYTAKERGLPNPFDIEQALPASAKFLKELHGNFGSWGLAAAAYNAGPARVARWLGNGGFLPLETEDYVLDITGRTVDHYSNGDEISHYPLDQTLSFFEACLRLPLIRTNTTAMATRPSQPWAIQVAGNFRRSVVSAQWARLQKKNPSLFSSHQAYITRIRTPMGRRGVYVARIGAESRKSAENLCEKIRAANNSCIIRKNH